MFLCAPFLWNMDGQAMGFDYADGEGQAGDGTGMGGAEEGKEEEEEEEEDLSLAEPDAEGRQMAESKEVTTPPPVSIERA